MKRLLFLIAVALGMALSTGSFAQTDSTGVSSKGVSNYGDVIASSTWNRVSGKPATATRWPTWHEVSGKPSAFPPEPHHHDSRYDARYVKVDSSPMGRSCSSGKYVAGIKSNGQLECKTLPKSSGGGNQCATGAEWNGYSCQTIGP